MMGDRKFILSESKIIYMFKGIVRSLAVTANAKSSQRGLDVSRRFGGLAQMVIKENGAHQRNMVRCTPTTCSFHLLSCCLAATTQRLS